MFEQFTVVPAIDLKGGEVVRLLRGEMARATVYGSDPAAVARKFEEQGADLIHVVDLDGAVAGRPRNLAAIAKIRAVVSCAIDVSGGLRTLDTVRAAFAAGADRVSIGSAAFLNPDLVRRACAEFAGRVFGSLDLRDGRLAIKGWVETSELTVDRAAAIFKDAGVAALTVTDIARDGAETGVDAARMATLAHQAGVPVIASGGVATLSDLRALADRFKDGVAGAIVGRALYEGRFDLPAAIAISR
ncbi:MAG TPA: 1-(5-phosphoribosyl)-5-[(5-phosphoribosylamino)methylideneamino]imidazole-4-carboxamide isomerase [Candidatus Binataceae bacterium]|nr:1-(5-phosphoribosyl)-5-[(5-phosphoribosylamino)methylideneamino]imidazole-4-carboxamide isomerase [Candidatus Binataceae bacterium]